MTVHPRSRKVRAVSRPKPDEQPVTRMVLVETSYGDGGRLG
jgi:hypothetical protein